MTAHRRAKLIRETLCLLFSLLALVLGLAIAESRGQSPPIHYFHRADLPPGTVGQGMIQRGGPLPGYVQPVELHVPNGVRISVTQGGLFGPPEKGPVKLGMMIGQVYRLKITNIPRQPGLELFPTIEVVNRLYPPRGKEANYPVPIVFTLEELNLALDNNYITRVIYLENPNLAFPQVERPSDQRYFEVKRHEDPLEVADRLGRPMAIMRVGSRIPDLQQVNGDHFLYGAPDAQRYLPVDNRPQPHPATPEVTERSSAVIYQQNYPRVHLQPTLQATPYQQRQMQR